MFTGYRLSLGLSWLVIVAIKNAFWSARRRRFLWQEYSSLISAHHMCIITIAWWGCVLGSLDERRRGYVNHILNLPGLIQRGISKLVSRPQLEVAKCVS